MGIEVVKLGGGDVPPEAMDRIAGLLDRLTGSNTASEQLNKLRDAKEKMLAAGYSEGAISAMAMFAKDVGDFISIMGNAFVTASSNKHPASVQFSMEAAKYFEISMNNTYDMLEKSGVDPDIFGLRSRDKARTHGLQEKLADLKTHLREHFTMVVTNQDTGEVRNLHEVTEGDAAIEALAEMGYSISRVRKQ